MFLEPVRQIAHGSFARIPEQIYETIILNAMQSGFSAARYFWCNCHIIRIGSVVMSVILTLLPSENSLLTCSNTFITQSSSLRPLHSFHVKRSAPFHLQRLILSQLEGILLLRIIEAMRQQMKKGTSFTGGHQHLCYYLRGDRCLAIF